VKSAARGERIEGMANLRAASRPGLLLAREQARMTGAARPRSRRAWLAIALAAGFVAAAALRVFALRARTPVSSVVAPAPQPGWPPALADSLSGPARQGVDPAWTAGIGTQYQHPGCLGSRGTEEAGSHTAAAASVLRGGAGYLNITAISSGDTSPRSSGAGTASTMTCSNRPAMGSIDIMGTSAACRRSRGRCAAAAAPAARASKRTD
jgi:hypothetical protein